ncbi:branched-chain amino acid aminotransferase [Alkalibacterium putridalgicola]|uniref:Branched-chain-amino-acid aminotransferase n=1 Tax=Alkalibacterium putridalgicola TaxID=426703 RepID=A0A1H7R4H3_9LACT|nr:branched-chain amino acid aminotransferase [Alkalibacterium putridalgicola]GEK90051.1 branched-chain-amino-acid aminotransferase [Alkalibacterium putridalgicola]SEL55186.1 branched-chain amino acid aminotransferase [Alkalibacterium putridalgicola]
MQNEKGIKQIDWENLGFSYIKTDYRFLSHYKDGQWDEGSLTTDNTLHISEGSTALHYGQQCFEGMKAYRAKDGSINLFRPYENARRMRQSCERLLMPSYSEEAFVEAVKKVVKANEEWVPPYGSGSSLYIRPFVIGVGDNIGVKPAEEYIFSIFVLPVGAYFKGGLKPSNFLVSSYDRAAPRGTGASKVGGNYAASLLPGKEAKERHYSDAVYLDPATQTKIEEVGAANFFGITHDDEFITPKSPSILNSITKRSLMWVAENRLGLTVKEGDVYIDELDRFKEAGACGTAAVIAPIGGLQVGNDFHVFYSEEEVGPVTMKLYNELVGIQFGDVKAPEGWIVKVD